MPFLLPYGAFFLGVSCFAAETIRSCVVECADFEIGFVLRQTSENGDSRQHGAWQWNSVSQSTNLMATVWVVRMELNLFFGISGISASEIVILMEGETIIGHIFPDSINTRRR
jgi:hypothetical protein